MTSGRDEHADVPLALAVEIGGRGPRAALATKRGELIEIAEAGASDTTALATVETVNGLIDRLLAHRRLNGAVPVGIGVAFGGPVDAGRGVTIRSHRTEGFEQLPLAGMLEESFGLHTVLENDARASALGEFTFGAGRGARDMVYLHLGHGVGGGLILGGRLQHGASMTSGELGHMVVSNDGPRCSCGKPGHLEAYASESAIVGRMRLRLADATLDRRADWLASPGVTVRRVFESYDGDDDARHIVDETVHVIGLAAANLVTALNPDAVVIGGYVAEIGPMLTAGVRAKIRQYAFDAAARRVTVAASQLGADAALVGAAVLAHSA